MRGLFETCLELKQDDVESGDCKGQADQDRRRGLVGRYVQGIGHRDWRAKPSRRVRSQMPAGLHGDRKGNGIAHLQRPYLRRAGERKSLQGRSDKAAGLGASGGGGIRLGVSSFGRRFVHLYQKGLCNLFVLGLAGERVARLSRCFLAPSQTAMW